MMCGFVAGAKRRCEFVVMRGFGFSEGEEAEIAPERFVTPHPGNVDEPEKPGLVDVAQRLRAAQSAMSAARSKTIRFSSSLARRPLWDSSVLPPWFAEQPSAATAASRFTPVRITSHLSAPSGVLAHRG